MKKPIISVIIRTKNEEKYLSKVLDIISSQTFKNFEIIIVDDHSTDKTLDIARNYVCKIVPFPEERFSHARSCNIGARNAKGEYLVYLNGHSIPISKNFLRDGLKNFENRKVAGVYASVLAHEDSTLADKFLYNIVGYTIGKIRYRASKYVTSGLLGTTNAMIRKDLWEEKNFDEEINNGWGGEDTDWALSFMQKGYELIHDPKFSVRHSHHLRWKDISWQRQNWKKMGRDSQIPEKQRKYF